MCDVGKAIKKAANVATFGTYGIAENAIKGRNILDGNGFGFRNDPSGPDFDMTLFQTDYLNQRRGEYDQWAGQFTDPTRYANLSSEYQQNAYTRAADQYASAGLAGSSAAIGGATEAGRKVSMDMLNRQLSDRSQIESTRLGYTAQLQNAGTAQMNAEIAKSNADNQMLGSILGAAGTVGGAILGGAPGAAVGGKIGAGAGGGQSAYLPQNTAMANYDYMSPGAAYGEPGNYWSQNPYAPKY